MKRAILIILIILMTVTLNAKAIRIVLMGDNRPSGEASQPYIFHKMLKKMAALKPDAIISTGDIISGYTDDAEKIKSMFDEFDDTIKIVGDIPFYVVPGNHDMVYAREPRKEYIRRYGKTYYSFNMENCHFIMLSSEEPGERGRIAGEQLKWLKADLKKYKDKKMHRFVCVHQPFYPRIAHVGNSLDQFPGQRDKIVSLLKKNNIEMTICGHIHIYNYCVVDGFHQIITGGAGAPPYASTYEKGGFYHFVYMIVDGDYVDYRLVIMENEMDIAAKFRRQKKFAEAEKIIQKAFTLVPNHPEPHIAATLLYHYRGDEEKFNQQFQQLLVFKNNDKEKALLDLAITLYYSDNNLDMAVEFINRIRKINPANDQALYELAEMYNEENQMSMASKTFKEVVKINPKHFQANYRMGKTFYNAGKYKTALKCFKNALKHCGESGYKMYIKRYIKRCKKKSKK